MLHEEPTKKREQISLVCIDELVPQNHLLRKIDHRSGQGVGQQARCGVENGQQDAVAANLGDHRVTGQLCQRVDRVTGNFGAGQRDDVGGQHHTQRQQEEPLVAQDVGAKTQQNGAHRFFVHGNLAVVIGIVISAGIAAHSTSIQRMHLPSETG